LDGARTSPAVGNGRGAQTAMPATLSSFLRVQTPACKAITHCALSACCATRRCEGCYSEEPNTNKAPRQQTVGAFPLAADVVPSIDAAQPSAHRARARRFAELNDGIDNHRRPGSILTLKEIPKCKPRLALQPAARFTGKPSARGTNKLGIAQRGSAKLFRCLLIIERYC
jgi:hypothetical protein